MKSELSSDDFELLTWALALATTATGKAGDAPMVRRMLKLIDTVNADNPSWHPFQVGEIPEGL